MASSLTLDATVDAHPLLDVGSVRVTWPAPLGQAPAPDWLRALLRPDAPGPGPGLPAPDDAVRGAVRDLLRHGGYKPTGRGKPASEYLLRAAGDGSLGSINAAVDVGNAVSLHTGLPLSVVDLGKARGGLPLRVGLAPAGARYVFNAAGQDIDLAGLLCLFDAEGPCANAVKDAQRTKTDAGTTDTLVVVWGTRALPGRTAAALAWVRALCAQAGATVGD